MKLLNTLALAAAFSLAAGSANSQSLNLPQASQRSEVMQTIGLSTVTVNYHSPAVKGRAVWGSLVPWDQVWRCGANDNTVVTFSHDAMVEGKAIPAGTYGLHMIPTQNKWTIIFSKNSTSWGSYFYDQKEDALRVTVTPKNLNRSVEWLNFGFADREAENATMYLEWEKIQVPVKVGFDVKSIVLADIRNDLRHLNAWSWQANQQAASYCLQNNFNHEEGLQWINRSLQYYSNFTSVAIKAGLLRQQGKDEEANKIVEAALPKASETEVNAYGYQLLGMGKADEAIVIFKKNIKDHPKSWNTYDSLADAYDKSGDKANSRKYYEMALKKNPPAAQVQRIEGVLQTL